MDAGAWTRVRAQADDAEFIALAHSMGSPMTTGVHWRIAGTVHAPAFAPLRESGFRTAIDTSAPWILCRLRWTRLPRWQLRPHRLRSFQYLADTSQRMGLVDEISIMEDGGESVQRAANQPDHMSTLETGRLKRGGTKASELMKIAKYM